MLLMFPWGGSLETLSSDDHVCGDYSRRLWKHFQGHEPGAPGLRHQGVCRIYDHWTGAELGIVFSPTLKNVRQTFSLLLLPL